jgi:hypothetical protein
MHLFGRNRDHNYYFELPREEERATQSATRCSTTHDRDVRLVPRVSLGLGPLNLMKIGSSKCRIGQARSGEIEFALEKLRLSKTAHM